MLSGIEVLLHPKAYDFSRNEYIDIFEDPNLAHSSYDELCEGLLKDSAYSCMLAVACTNSVIGNGTMTYCPPTAVPKLLSNPLTKEMRDLSDVENEGHGGVDDEHQVHINKNDGDDGLLDDPQTNDVTNDESSHVGLLDNPQTNSDTNDEGSHDGLLDDPQTNSDTRDEGSHDGLLDNPQTNSDTNDEGSHDGLLDDPHTNSDTRDEGSHDGLLDNLQTNDDENDESSHDKLLADPQTNSHTNDEGVRVGCNVADRQPLLNNFMKLERLILCLAENENTYVYKELPEEKKNNCFSIIDNTKC
ncbi:hypothetical protein PoB_006281000 [Plakobranchus ocellatus]|uniref:Uncharacterized protein n=1 Tax=Plakobranchus ocellatus TaxID=259542 RepID=A0AAV4CWZ6_9GAST|nr:hypothetical protein PoB_006281000 [Plakobranchus ocellatus]